MALPSQSEIEDVLNECSENEQEGIAKFPGMTYEQGVKYGIEWVMGESDENPMDG